MFVKIAVDDGSGFYFLSDEDGNIEFNHIEEFERCIRKEAESLNLIDFDFEKLYYQGHGKFKDKDGIDVFIQCYTLSPVQNLYSI